jgi:hypothetical protein
VGRTQRIPGGDEASWRGHFENNIRVPGVHHKMSAIDNNGAAAIRHGYVYSCIIIYAFGHVPSCVKSTSGVQIRTVMCL